MEHSYSILLVDDEQLAIDGLRHGVDWEKLNIRKIWQANSMEEALKTASRFPVDMMISDIEMPGGSGLELIRRIRELYPDVICIFYTAHPDFSYCQEALKMNAADYLVKPVAYHDMEAAIQKALGIVEEQKDINDLKNIWGDVVRKEKSASAVETVKNIIACSLASEISRDELAEAVYMSPDYLTRIFKKETGMSISDYIIDKRLSLARKLLEETDFSIVEISQKTGFSYSSYFVRLFQKKTGMTPA